MSKTIGGAEPYPALMLRRPIARRVDAPAVPRPSLLTATWVAMMAAGVIQMLASILGG
ncbi:hypothetical protein [Paludisphaera sp.]|uniref:hypothetical protein n=1 Tax=Paludisphaera sp. TaxID=2017432 RepID=UPI00301DD6FA